jgi:hypothetical protein
MLVLAQCAVHASSGVIIATNACEAVRRGGSDRAHDNMGKIANIGRMRTPIHLKKLAWFG